MAKIVLLYNDQDVAVVRQVRRELMQRWPDIEFWIADENLTAKDNLVAGIKGAIQAASGVAIFIGTHGLGRFQERIEIPAVEIATWLRNIDRVLVHLAPRLIPPEDLAEVTPVNRDGALTDPSALAVAIAQRFKFEKPTGQQASVAEKIVLLHHPADRLNVRRIQASLRRKIDDKKYILCSQDDLSDFGEPADRLLNAITKPWGVFVVVGANGPGAEFEELVQGPAKQAVVDQGAKPGRARITLGRNAAVPDVLSGWPHVIAADPVNYDGVAEEMLGQLKLEPRWTIEVAIKKAMKELGENNVSQKKLSEVARNLTEGKPLTLLLGPYAVPEPQSCPSKIRQALLDLLKDQPLYSSLVLPVAGMENESFPVLWQDHLATLCLLANCDRNKIAATIRDAVSAYPGDQYGPPAPLFNEVAEFVQHFIRYGPGRSPALPAVTIIAVCPGLRMERALVARGCAFERATMLFGADGWGELHHKIYRPSNEDIGKASDGDPDYMPEPQDRQAIDEQQVQFVRLIKLGGSRDLNNSIAIDFGQSYRMLAELRFKLEPLVSAAGIGPYLALGGGLATPPLQAAHALLLRTALQKQDQRPQLALVGKSTMLPDPLFHAEIGRLINLTRTPQSGFDTMEVVDGAPELFLQALSVAFAGAPEKPRRD